MGLPAAVPERAFVEMFPQDWVTDAPFPFVKELVIGPPFREWLDARDYDVDGVQAPIISTRIPRGPRLGGAGTHHGTFFSAPVVYRSCSRWVLAPKSTSLQHGTCLSQWVRAGH